MTGQLSLADAVTDAAIRRVRGNADTDWLERAHRLVRVVAATLGEFTTDDLWARGLDQPREPRALGAVMREAQRAGVCRPTDRYRRSNRVECHTRPLRVWVAGAGR